MFPALSIKREALKVKIHYNNDGTLWAGFDCQYLAEEFAEKVNGKVKFSPLPDYMGMIAYWVVIWEK